MTRRRVAPSVRLAHVLLWAGPVSGQMFTLSNFQMITSLSVPLSCILAYNTPILGCSLRDITNNSCPPGCQQSLADAQYNIQGSCNSVNVGPDTLLYQAQKGMLVYALCGSGNDGSTVTATVTRTPPPPPPPQTTLRSFTVIPPESTAASTTTTSTTIPTSSTSTTSTSQRSETFKSTIATSTRTTQSGSTSQEVATTPPQASTGDESTTSPTSSTTAAPPRQTLIPGSGGGSPFDFVAAGALTRPSAMTAALPVVACVLGLLLAQ